MSPQGKLGEVGGAAAAEDGWCGVCIDSFTLWFVKMRSSIMVASTTRDGMQLWACGRQGSKARRRAICMQVVRVRMTCCCLQSAGTAGRSAPAFNLALAGAWQADDDELQVGTEVRSLAAAQVRPGGTTPHTGACTEPGC